MSLYNNYIGIDIGKLTFVVGIYGCKITKEYANDTTGIHDFINDYKDKLSDGLCVLEPTGGYEISLLYTLCDQGFVVHRANTRKVKNFIRSFGNGAKTDSLDAKALALYGYERNERLEKFTPCSETSIRLYNLIQRRKDLKQMLVAEKNRLKNPKSKLVSTSCETMIKVINDQVEILTDEINKLISADNTLKQRQQILKSIAGIGEIVSQELLILLPELGTINRRQIASLAGLAPRANDSGSFSGYRRTGAGRNTVKPILFLAAMAARRSNSALKEYYEKLIKRGKKKMVALTALMRKIIVIANARLKGMQ